MKLPFIVFADWNMDPKELLASGFAETLFSEIMVATNIAETCITGSTLDYLLVSRNFTSAIVSFAAFAGSPWRTHKGFQLEVVKSPRSIHVLSLLKPMAVPIDDLVDMDLRPD